jgi:hypothetical protein
MKLPKHTYLTLVLALAVALHAYEVVRFGRGAEAGDAILFLLMVFVWALTPYAVLVVVATFFRQPLLANGVATVVFVLDLAMHHDVLASKSSTATLGFLFQPFWTYLLRCLRSVSARG